MDIVVRAVFLYIFVVFVMRVIGRRELSSMTPFDLILLIVLGDALQQGLTQDDYSVTGAVLAVATIATLQVFTSYLSFRSRRARKLLEGAAHRRRREKGKTGRSQPQTRANHYGRSHRGNAAAADRLARRDRVGDSRVQWLY